MDQKQCFEFTYSAKQQKEIENIRKKYLPQSESTLDELKRLDEYVENSGMVEAICAGIGGLLVFGLGMCFSMQVIGSGVLMVVFGVLLGIAGIAGMVAAYPVYRTVFSRTKTKYTPRILELVEELSGENSLVLQNFRRIEYEPISIDGT